MDPRALLDTLTRQDIRVTRNGDRLHVDAPAGAITPELRAALAENKPALLALLAGEKGPSGANLGDALARRVEAFREQLRTPGPIPFLYLPGAPSERGRCLSCGESPTDAYGTRCNLCAQAAAITLREVARP